MIHDDHKLLRVIHLCQGRIALGVTRPQHSSLMIMMKMVYDGNYGGASDSDANCIDGDGHQHLDCVKSHALVIGFSGR